MVKFQDFSRADWLLAVLGVMLIGAIGFVDYLTGPDIAFSLFYLAVVALLAWRLDSLPLALLLAILSAIAWLIADWLTQGSKTVPVLLWNSTTRLMIFTLVAVLLFKLNNSIRREQQMARTDHLTGALNARAFGELVRAEIAKSIRYARPFAIGYIDLDDFKTINDRHGHSEGDRVLCAVATTIRTVLRDSDVLARLGGDEFGLLLPETEETAVTATFERLRKTLMNSMAQQGRPITCSIGAVVFQKSLEDVDDMIRMADQLMYAAKARGKDQLCVASADAELPPERVSSVG